MDRRPRSVPPVFQPEVAAETIYKAADEQKREYWLGRSAIGIILANAIAPPLLDRNLARAAISGQAKKRKVSGERRDNPLKPVRERHRMRGSLGREASYHALTVPGPVTRISAATAGIVCVGVLCAAIGYLARR